MVLLPLISFISAFVTSVLLLLPPPPLYSTTTDRAAAAGCYTWWCSRTQLVLRAGVSVLRCVCVCA